MVDTEIFFAWIKTQSHCNIKTLPTANESEFMSMRSFLVILEPFFTILAPIHLNKIRFWNENIVMF